MSRQADGLCNPTFIQRHGYCCPILTCDADNQLQIVTPNLLTEAVDIKIFG